MRRPRPLSRWLALAVFGLPACVVGVAGCEIIAGINEKTLGGGEVGGGGAGGLGAGGSGVGGAGGAGSGSDAGAGLGGGTRLTGDPICAPGALGDEECARLSTCTKSTPKDIDSCNCGRCDHSCGGMTCEASYCKPGHMADGLPYTYRIATNGVKLFLTSQIGGASQAGIYSLSLDPAPGEAPALLTTDMAIDAAELAADCDFVYFSGEKVLGQLGLFRVPVGGGAIEVLSPDESEITHLITDGKNVYWIVVNANSFGRVKMRYPTGTIRELTGELEDPSGLSVDGTHIYWSLGGLDQAANHGTIYRAAIPKEGSAPVIDVVVGDAGHARALALDEDWVYWVDRVIPAGDNVLYRALKSGVGATQTVATHPLRVEAFIAVDGESVYWLSNQALYKASKDGSGSTLPITEPSNLGHWDAWASYFVTDRSRVYFVDTGSEASPVNWVAK